MEFRGGWLVAFAVLFLFLSAIDGKGDEDRSGKNVLGLFNVIKFENSHCSGNNNLNGTCYTSDECTKLGGSSAGTCASGFGVCCTFSLSCGGTTMENNTYAIMNAYNTANDPSPCTYTICRNSPDVKKLRIDLTTFSIGGPFVAPTNPAESDFSKATEVLAQKATHKLGDCYGDRFTVASPGANVPPTICGLNTGQHMYVDASDSCTTLSFNIDTLDILTARKWYLEVKQLTAMNEDTFHNCLQYHRGASGTVFNYNYDTSISENTKSSTAGFSNNHLADQKYDICFRREETYCSLCFSVVGVGTSSSGGSYGIGVSGDAAGTKAVVNAGCTGVSSTGHGDYIEIEGLYEGANARVDRVCGNIFAAVTDATTHVTACTKTLPFRMGVNFDGGELFVSQGTNFGTNAAKTGENYSIYTASKGGGGTTGFYMHYFQVKC